MFYLDLQSNAFQLFTWICVVRLLGVQPKPGCPCCPCVTLMGGHCHCPCRYFLRATVSRRLNDVVKEMDIVVHTLSTYPELNSSIKMEVGIEDCLHIEFEYNKSK